MKRFRKQLLFLCDSFILITVAFVLSQFVRRYGLGDAIGLGGFWPHLGMLFGCTTVFQLLFRNYDSLWRYAESREYLSLLFAAFCGFAFYEIINHLVLRGGDDFFPAADGDCLPVGFGYAVGAIYISCLSFSGAV